jgi:hypothetical protein
MEWLAGVLALLLLLFIALYRKSLKESRDLTNFALLILLDEGVCADQRKALTELVRSIDARNGGDLGAKVNLATAQLAARLGHTLLGTAGLLWKLRKDSSLPR